MSDIELLKNVDRYNSYCEKVKECLNQASIRYLELGCYLKKIQDEKLFELDGFENLLDCSKTVFGLKKSTTYNFIGLYQRFGTVNEWGYFGLKEEYKDYNYSQLVELVSVEEEKIKDFTPQMTVREIRAKKVVEDVFEKYYEILRSETVQNRLKHIENSIQNHLAASIVSGLGIKTDKVLEKLKLEKDGYGSYVVCTKAKYTMIPKQKSYYEVEINMAMNDLDKCNIQFVLKMYEDGLSYECIKTSFENVYTTSSFELDELDTVKFEKWLKETINYFEELISREDEEQKGKKKVDKSEEMLEKNKDVSMEYESFTKIIKKCKDYLYPSLYDNLVDNLVKLNEIDSTAKYSYSSYGGYKLELIYETVEKYSMEVATYNPVLNISMYDEIEDTYVKVENDVLAFFYINHYRKEKK